jgi:hypothetical protein
MSEQPTPTLADLARALTLVNRRVVRWSEVAQDYLGDAGDDQASRNLAKAVEDLGALADQIKHLSTQTT